jgi:glucose/arabinose dehydrogenase
MSIQKKRIIIFSCLVFFLTTTQPCCSDQIPAIGKVPQQVEDQFLPDPPDIQVETWVKNLEIPWSLVFLPNGDALVSERPGRIKIIRKNQNIPEPYTEILETLHLGEGGLMGLAVHPRFEENPYIYAMHTYRGKQGPLNRVIRLHHQEKTAVFDTVIIDNIPGHRVHDGGRIGFGPDGMLYVCTGDIWQADLAQDKSSLSGKILRLTPDGEIPKDNPFPDSPVWSLGNRNPQGLAWHHETGVLFSSEHGPSGEFGLRGMDEINIIQKGANFGWPRVVGAAGNDPYHDPVVMWIHATPPGGMAFVKNDLYVATLRSEALIRIRMETADGDFRVSAIERWFATDNFSGKYGRLRDVVLGPDKSLYVLTSNRDGRGSPRPDDDKILRIVFAE